MQHTLSVEAGLRCQPSDSMREQAGLKIHRNTTSKTIKRKAKRSGEVERPFLPPRPRNSATLLTFFLDSSIVTIGSSSVAASLTEGLQSPAYVPLLVAGVQPRQASFLVGVEPSQL